jgi:hypothetical protein
VNWHPVRSSHRWRLPERFPDNERDWYRLGSLVLGTIVGDERNRSSQT